MPPSDEQRRIDVARRASTSRAVSSAFTGLRLRASGLRGHLARHGLVPSGMCVQCDTGQTETTEHFLLDCPRYREQRRRMAGRTPAVRRRDVRALLCPDRRPRRRRDARRPGDEERPPEAEPDPAADLDVVEMVSDLLRWLGTANNGAQGAVVSAGCRDPGPD